MYFKKEQFTTSQDGTLVAETSELRVRTPPQQIKVDGVTYRQFKIDNSGGDIAGWWYENLTRQKLLIIND